MLSLAKNQFLKSGTKLAHRKYIKVSKKHFHYSTSTKNKSLKQILSSSQIQGITKGSGDNLVYTGCPDITPDPRVLSRALEHIKKEKGFIFETDKVSLLEHSYLATQNITTDFSTAIKLLGTSKFRQIICSPKLHIMEWLLSFPFGAEIEYLTVKDGVARLMGSDPVKLSRATTKQVDTDGTDAEVTTYWDVAPIYEVLTSKPEFAPSGVVVTHFEAQTLVDLGGKSHMLPGTVNHGRATIFGSNSVSLIEYRLGMGGGSLNGGALNNVVGYLTWKAQFSAIEQMHLEAEFWKFAADFCDCTSPQEVNVLLMTYKNQWSAKPQLIGLLNQLANPVRYLLTEYARIRGVSPQGSVKDRYFLKAPRHKL